MIIGETPKTINNTHSYNKLVIQSNYITMKSVVLSYMNYIKA